MDAAVVRQFLNFFQDFIDFCQWKEWPNNNTSEEEIRSAFIKSRHIEKCLDKFQKNGTLNEFLDTLNSNQDSVDAFLKACLTDPPKYILKKIINSNCKVNLMDAAFKSFMQLFSKQTLENYLTDLIVEASSKQTLLKHLPTEITREKILKFKSEIFLSQITADSKQAIQDMVTDYNQDIVELVVVSLCNTDSKHQTSVNILSQCILDVLLTKTNHYKNLWKLLFNSDDEYLIKMCVENSDVYSYMCDALVDCGKLLKENMSAQYFYIDLTYAELASITKRLFKNDFLKAQFVDVVNNNHENELDFWRELL